MQMIIIIFILKLHFNDRVILSGCSNYLKCITKLTHFTQNLKYKKDNKLITHKEKKPS